MKVSVIAAVADNNAIGRRGDLAFHISADLKHFKELTMGRPVIMGRKTFESLPSGALPGRLNIVITRNPAWSAPDTVRASSLDDALGIAAEQNPEEVFIIGGGQIYSRALPLADVLHITRIFAAAEGADTFFPPYEDSWRPAALSEIFTDPKTGLSYQFQTFLNLRKHMTKAEQFNDIFDRCVRAYHITDCIDAPVENPYPEETLEHVLWNKHLIDARQWHMEDVIRDPAIDPVEALELKRRIDRSNQERTDLVEAIDEWFRDAYRDVTVLPGATINTETPAWAIDRLSILALKIWHMKAEAERADATPEHRQKCAAKLDVLMQQRADLTAAIDSLIDDIAAGRKYMKVYKQMKMYNDTDTNPVLYGSK